MERRVTAGTRERVSRAVRLLDGLWGWSMGHNGHLTGGCIKERGWCIGQHQRFRDAGSE